MSKKLLHLGNDKFVLQLKISDCWCIENQPIRWKLERLENPEYPEWTGWRIVLFWLAAWFVFRAKQEVQP